MKKIAFIVFFISFGCYARNYQEIFLAANKAYHEDDYQQALNQYQSVRKKGRAVWYNMGNCEYELGNYSRAIACWKRAQKGARWHESDLIMRNIQMALRKMNKPIERSLQDRVYQWLVRVTEYNSLYMLQMLFLIVWYLFFLCGFVIRKQTVRVFGRVAMSLFLVVCGVGLTVKTIEYGNDHGIIVEQTPLFVGPDTRYQHVATLDQADSVSIAQRNDEWCKVCVNGKTGWVPHNTLELI